MRAAVGVMQSRAASPAIPSAMGTPELRVAGWHPWVVSPALLGVVPRGMWCNMGLSRGARLPQPKTLLAVSRSREHPAN